MSLRWTFIDSFFEEAQEIHSVVEDICRGSEREDVCGPRKRGPLDLGGR
jgi:hypothetical protein